MFRPLFLKFFLLGFVFARDGEISSLHVSENTSAKPAVEILMHLPPEFENLNGFLSYFRGAAGPGDKMRKREPQWRRKREAEESQTQREGLLEESESLPAQEALTDKLPNPLTVPMMDIPESIARSLYSSYESERSAPVNDNEDRVQRDKRTFMDGERETTTVVPYWKRKKESPPFVTGRDGAGQKVGNYQPAQHRSVDNARESHSMKDLDKTVLSNEITRNNQDSFFTSTNRRTYNSRQAENYTPRAPKSVYDTIDYNNRRRPQDGRSAFGRNVDAKRQREKESAEQFARQYTYPRPYDRPYYPFQGDVVGRGIEYYHRTFDPASGRIIYYANMPDPSRHYDPNFTYGDPSGRSIYIHGRTYLYDPYGRSFITPNDYRANVYGRSIDYLRNGRSSSDFHYQDNKGQRNSRFNGINDRSKDDFRNRTYIIFDADENSFHDQRVPFIQPDYNRIGYPAPLPFGLEFTPPAAPPPIHPNHPFRNQYYPTVQTPLPWLTSQKPFPGVTTPNYITRPLNVPEVQLPLSTRNRSLYPIADYDKMKKT